MKNWIYHYYWIPRLHKCLFKQSYIAWSAKCSTKPLSKLLTCILSAVKTGLQSYCDTSYSRGGVNQIMKNSKDMLEYIQYRSLSSCNSIKPFDFSTLYTTIPHSKLKDKLRELVQLCFITRNGQGRYKYLMLGRDSEVRLRGKLYDKSDDFNFSIMNFPFICSMIPAATAYGVGLSVDTIFQS